MQAGVNQPGRIEKVDLKLPKGVEITRIADKSLNEMLLSGEIDAALVARAPDAFVKGNPKIRRLFDDFMDVEIDYYKKTGIFPIMHAVAVRRDVLDKNPWVARNLFTAFEEAKRRSIERVQEATISLFPIPWYFEHARRGMELLGQGLLPLRHRAQPQDARSLPEMGPRARRLQAAGRRGRDVSGLAALDAQGLGRCWRAGAPCPKIRHRAKPMVL